jgi:hypothetical protein
VRIIGRIVALVLIGLAAGCDLELVGVIGPNGGYFVCTDNNDCSGH